jgi:glyoxylase-like metal-dependent hydrolase (beta-lactamase superfamily II)/rhodanese-related sulfurtransferase
MYFKQILDEKCGCSSYVIGSRQSKEAAIVDPSVSTEQYDTLLAERGFRLRYVIDTHVHADHVSGARALAQAHGAELCLHQSARVAYAFRGLEDGDVLEVGQLRLRVVHTPGHRPELISLLITNPLRSSEPSMVLTGDSLLVGDVGRPDFGGGDAWTQYDSIHRLLQLPDWVAVFPGHFEGACGKGMCGRPNTTIGFERLFSPLTNLSRDEFVETLSSQVPPRPLNITAIEATNRGLADLPWAMLTTTLPVEEIDLDTLENRLPGAILVDVREPEEYAHGHIGGAINLPQADLATRISEIPFDRPVITVCQAGMRSLRAAQFLKQQGYMTVASVVGGTGAWRESGRPIVEGEVGAAAPNILESEWAHGGST